MKTNLMAVLIISGLALALHSSAVADDKEKTITGDGMCAKCELKETKTCQTAIKVTEGDKTTTYYLVENEVSKKFHDSICKKPAKVKAIGTVKMVDGKLDLTPSSIELVKEQASPLVFPIRGGTE